jgi:hypothetical protein
MLTQQFAYLLLIKYLLAVFKLPGLVAQLFPSYSSVAPVRNGGEPGLPPKLMLLFEYHILLNYLLAVFKGLEVVQLVPSYSSVAFCDPGGASPPKASPAV